MNFGKKPNDFNLDNKVDDIATLRKMFLAVYLVNNCIEQNDSALKNILSCKDDTHEMNLILEYLSPESTTTVD